MLHIFIGLAGVAAGSLAYLVIMTIRMSAKLAVSTWGEPAVNHRERAADVETFCGDEVPSK